MNVENNNDLMKKGKFIKDTERKKVITRNM